MALLRHLLYIVSAYYVAYDMNMDMKKLLKKVWENKKVRSIPLNHVLIVLGVVIEEIGSGECFLDTEYD